MKMILALALFGATFISGCTTAVMADGYGTRAPVMAEIHQYSRPVMITEVYYPPVVIYTPASHCYWYEAPVYGYVDIYRDGQTHIRIKEVVYTDQQWRCN
jgi:hypothetical protein